MTQKRLPKSLRKFIRQEKSRLRRQIFGAKEQEEKIKEMLQKIRARYNP